MNYSEHTQVVLKVLKQNTDEVILFYSGGRDSVVLLDLLSRSFQKVHCVFMYFLPGMSVYNPFIEWVKRYPNATFHQYPHWNTAQLLKGNFLNFNAANQSDVPTLKLADIERKARADIGCDWIIQGFKKSDGLQRRLFLNTYEFEAINRKAQKAFPLSHWSQQNVEEYILFKKLIKPITFKGQKTHGIGLNENALVFLRERFPEDLKIILSVFPLASKILFDYDNRQQSSSASKI